MNKQHTKQNREHGAALLIFTILFLFASVALIFGISRGAYQDILRYRILELSKESYFAAEAGVEDALYRHRQGESYSATESFDIGDVAVSVVRNVVGDHFQFTVTATTDNILRRMFLDLVLGSGASFSYGLQSDTGGIILENSSSVLGNIYSNGSVVGTGGGPDGNDVFGTVISAGPSGYVEGIHATGSVYSQDIEDTVADKDAYCDSISNSNVTEDVYCNTITSTIIGGSTFAGPGYQPTTSLPFSDDAIEDQKTAAEAGGVIASSSPECSGGTYLIDSDTTIGPVKIECNVLVDKTDTNLTLAGQVWIVGNLDTKSSPNFFVDPSLDGKSIPVIVDNPSNRSTSSKVTIQNSASFDGAGDESYILLISQNNDEEMGGSEVAINSQQGANGDILLFAAHGEILIEQSGGYTGIGALLIRLQNSAQIVYETGAVSLEFPDGPGGGYVVSGWTEIQ